jgi:hypothetical protein
MDNQNISPIVLMPDTVFKTVWNVLIITLLAYTATIAPFRIAFYESSESNSSQFFDVFDVFVDIVFGLDIVLNFISAYEKTEGRFEYDLKKIAINYLMGFFAIDFVATIPIQWFLGRSKESSNNNN